MNGTSHLFNKGIAMQKLAYRWIIVGFLVYLASWFFLKGSRQQIFFYLLIALPALCLPVYAYRIFRSNARAMFPFILFLAYFSLSALWGEGSFRESIKLGILIFCLALAIKATLSRFNAGNVANFIAMTGGIAIGTHVLAFLLSDTGFPSFANGRFSLYKSYEWGTDNPINSAIVLGLPIIAAWWLFPGRKLYIQILLFLLMVCSAILMFLTQSRGPIFALAAAISIMALFRRSKEDMALIIFGCIAVAMLFLFTNVGEQASARIAQPNYRMHIWQEAFRQFLDHFWIGQGFGNDARIPTVSNEVVTHAHSFILETFRTGGIVGGCLFFIMLFSMLDRSILKPSRFFFLLWLIYGVLCLLSNGRLLLIRPWRIECFAFWVPLLCLYFSAHYSEDTTAISGDM
jgi:O-antigen ligase